MSASPIDDARPKWRKSSHSTGQGSECVELAGLSAAVAVRDSKHPERPSLRLDRSGFGALISAVKRL